MAVHARGTSQTGAKGILAGTISNGATWVETLEFSENGAEISGASTSTWKMVFKECDGGSPVLTLTSGSEITITQNTTETLFAINCPQSSLDDLEGDYHVDIACQATGGGAITHWASGIVTIIDEDLGF